tara:strand:- start:576 stop:1268 length:693 start_codon:yes stop_codon:yes gene_type:complete
MKNKRVIVALDSKNLIKTKSLVNKIRKEVFAFKIGYEFFLNHGLFGYKEIKKISPKIFLDLKLHDIPNTVANAILAINKLNPLLTTVHITGGDEMLKSSIKYKKNSVKVLGVSILTSLDKKQIAKYYNEKSISNIVKRLVKNAKKHNLDGVVCSPHEIKFVRKELGNKYLIVTPGIRLENKKTSDDDQKRILTPNEAIDNGADYLVIGRPITKSNDPLKAIKDINKTINK